MKRFSKFLGNILGLASLAILAVVLALIFSSLGDKQAPSVSRSPRQSPTAISVETRKPTPSVTLTPEDTTFRSPLPTPTKAPTNTPFPTATPTLPPSATPTPRILPTVPGPFPPGPKVIYSENTHNSTVTFWAASATDPVHRRPVATAADPRDFGIHAALSHDMTRIAYVALPPGTGHDRSIAELWVVNIDGLESYKLMEQVDLGPYVNYPLWSPDDQHIVVLRQSSHETLIIQTISKVDAKTGEETILVQGDETDRLIPLAWAPDGHKLYYHRWVEGKPTVWSVARNGGVPQFVTALNEGESYPLCHYLSPDGTKLLCSDLKNRDPVQYQVIVVSVEGAKEKQAIEAASGASEHYDPIWNTYDHEITVGIPPQGQTRAQLRVINITTRGVRDLPLEDETFYVPRSWSPDGEWLAAHEHSKSGGDIYLISSNGMRIHRIPVVGATSILGWVTADLATATK